MVFSLAAFFVLFMYRHLTTLQLQRLYENFHKEAPADLLAHLGSLDACSNQCFYNSSMYFMEVSMLT